MIEWFDSSSTNIDKLVEFCKLSQGDDRPAAENMVVDDYESKPHTLLYKILIGKAYDGGGFCLYLEDGVPVAGSGYYVCDWHPNIYVLGSRTYTIPGLQRGSIHRLLWHEQVDIAKERGGKVLIASFNEYNKWFIDQAIRINDPKNWRSSFKEGWKWYRKPGVRITPLRKYPHSVMLNYTEQWLFYHLYDMDFEAEFLSICDSHRTA